MDAAAFESQCFFAIVQLEYGPVDERGGCVDISHVGGNAERVSPTRGGESEQVLLGRFSEGDRIEGFVDDGRLSFRKTELPELEAKTREAVAV